MFGAIFAGIGEIFGNVVSFGGSLFGGAASILGKGVEFLPEFAGYAAPIGLQLYGQERAIKKQAKTAEKIAARKLAYQRELVERQLEQQRELREKQMELQARQQMIGSLAGIFDRQDRQEIRYVTVPVVQREESLVDRINRAIGEFLAA